MKLWATIRKDIRILLRDRLGLSLMFGMPVILVIVVTSIQNSTFQLLTKKNVTMLLYNHDTGALSAQFAQAVRNIGMFRVLTVPEKDSKSVVSAMRVNDAMLALEIPVGFSRQLAVRAKHTAGKALNSFGLDGDTLTGPAGVPDLVNLYCSPSFQESVRLSVLGSLSGTLQAMESRLVLRNVYVAINEKPLPDSVENEMLNAQPGIKAITTGNGNATVIPNATQHNVPAWTIFAMFFIVISLSGSVIREKMSGSFIRLKTLPTNYYVALLSKQITYLAVTTLQAVVIFAIGIFLFPYINLPVLRLPSHMWSLLLVVLVCGWCAVNYAICIGVVARTPEQANGFAAISIVILAALGGLMVPSFAMPASLKTMMAISPFHWCLEAFYRLFLEGGGIADVMHNVLLLLFISACLQITTHIILKRKNLI